MLHWIFNMKIESAKSSYGRILKEADLAKNVPPLFQWCRAFAYILEKPIHHPEDQTNSIVWVACMPRLSGLSSQRLSLLLVSIDHYCGLSCRSSCVPSVPRSWSSRGYVVASNLIIHLCWDRGWCTGLNRPDVARFDAGGALESQIRVSGELDPVNLVLERKAGVGEFFMLWKSFLNAANVYFLLANTRMRCCNIFCRLLQMWLQCGNFRNIGKNLGEWEV
jgi:hypothetical protein